MKAKEEAKQKASEEKEAERRKKGTLTGGSGWWLSLALQRARFQVLGLRRHCSHTAHMLFPTPSAPAGREIFLEEGFVAQDDVSASGERRKWAGYGQQPAGTMHPATVTLSACTQA